MNFRNVCVFKFVFTAAFYGEVGGKEIDSLYVIKGKVLGSTDFSRLNLNTVKLHLLFQMMKIA